MGLALSALDIGVFAAYFVGIAVAGPRWGDERSVVRSRGIDMVLLVIAADESIKPQTREHFDICRLLGIPSGHEHDGPPAQGRGRRRL